MKKLKDLIKEDIQNIFLDIDEFAEIHAVEGKSILVVEDNDRLQELKAGVENALTEADKLLYAKMEDLPPRRGYGQFLNLDGKDWFVVSWEENFGMAEIALKRNEA